MSKSVQGVVRLRTHLVGAIAHSGLTDHGKKTFCCFDLFEYPHDPKKKKKKKKNTLFRHVSLRS